MLKFYHHVSALIGSPRELAATLALFGAWNSPADVAALGPDTVSTNEDYYDGYSCVNSLQGATYGGINRCVSIS